MTSAAKVLIPTTPLFVPYSDLTFDIPCSVTAIATLPFCIPSNIKDSFLIKLPLVSYTVNAVPADTACLRKPLAPLFLPSTKVPALKFNVDVGASLIVKSTVVCISKREISHSFKFVLVVL